MVKTFEVEKIVDMRMSGKKKEFLVKWKGYSAKENTWEPMSHLSMVKDMVEDFESSKSKVGGKRKAPEPEPEKPKAKSPPAKKAKVGTAGTRAMTTKPKRESAGKRVVEEVPKAPAPAAKKAKPAEKPKPKPKLDLTELGKLVMAELKGIKAAAPAKKETPAAKPRKEKPEAAVVEVDKILAMKTVKNGGLSYQILWQDGSKSWEPEDNVMDDDLVDEFEEEEQVNAYSGDKITVGDEVEIKNIDDGFENSWSAAVIKKKTGSKYTVEFSGFVDEKGAGVTESGIERKRVRLAPPAAEKGWEPVPGEIIEVNEDDCWWEARVLEINGKKASLKFRVSDEIKPAGLGTKKLRPCSWLKLTGKK